VFTLDSFEILGQLINTNVDKLGAFTQIKSGPSKIAPRAFKESIMAHFWAGTVQFNAAKKTKINLELF